VPPLISAPTAKPLTVKDYRWQPAGFHCLTDGCRQLPVGRQRNADFTGAKVPEVTAVFRQVHYREGITEGRSMR